MRRSNSRCGLRRYYQILENYPSRAASSKNNKFKYKTMSVKDRGFGSMDPEKQRSIASKGGRTVSKDRKHMSEIGKKGGKVVSADRKHMADIGRKGGKATYK